MRDLQGQVLGQSDVVIARQIVADQGQVGLGLVAMQAIQHLIPETDGSAAVGGSVIDQHVTVRDSQLVNTSQGPVRGGFDAEECAFGLRAVTRGHGDGHEPRQRQGSQYRTHFSAPRDTEHLGVFRRPEAAP